MVCSSHTKMYTNAAGLYLTIINCDFDWYKRRRHFSLKNAALYKLIFDYLIIWFFFQFLHAGWRCSLPLVCSWGGSEQEPVQEQMGQMWYVHVLTNRYCSVLSSTATLSLHLSVSESIITTFTKKLICILIKSNRFCVYWRNSLTAGPIWFSFTV